MRLSLKLGALCAAAALLPLFVASIVIVLRVDGDAGLQVRDQLQTGARSASALYEKRLVELRTAAAQIAESIASRAPAVTEPTDRASADQAWARLQDLLPRAQNDYSLDFVIVSDPQGRVLARHNDRPSPGETLLGPDDKNALVARVIDTNAAIAACAIERGERYERLWLDRLGKVKLADGSTVDEALMLEAAAPVTVGGRMFRVVLIGQMLNTYWKPRPGALSIQLPLVAETRQVFVRNADEDAGALVSNNRGVISSSIPPSSASRDSGGDPVLLGSMHDPSKAQETLSQGSSSYLVDWQPLKTLDGTLVGSIGVARSTRELTAPGESIRSALLVIGSIATVLAGTAGFLFGRLLGARVDELREAASRWTVGELSATTNDQDALESNGLYAFLKRDEIAVLAGQMEQMRMSFRLAIERLRKR
jgi:HAMP domain-containing protein